MINEVLMKVNNEMIMIINNDINGNYNKWKCNEIILLMIMKLWVILMIMIMIIKWVIIIIMKILMIWLILIMKIMKE